MEEKCPKCGSSAIEYRTYDDDPWGEQIVRTWDGCVCENGHEFIISEVFTLTSRIVAKDDDELNRLIMKEKEEER